MTKDHRPKPIATGRSIRIGDYVRQWWIASSPLSQMQIRRRLASSRNLRKGQDIGLKDVGTAFEITILADQPGPLGFTIVEVEHDFVVVADIAGVQQIRIPAYAIKAITTVGTPKEK